MSSTTVRISESSLNNLRNMAKKAGKPMQVILDEAVKEYGRKQFLEEANQAFSRLKQDRQAWQDEQEERRAWDTTLGDGLADEQK